MFSATLRDYPVPRADLELIVQAGWQPPSGKKGQITISVISDDAGAVVRISGVPRADADSDLDDTFFDGPAGYEGQAIGS